MRILITGASKGLGAVAVEEFQKDGWEVFPFTRKDFDYLNYPFPPHTLPETEVILHCAGGGLGLRGPLIPSQSFHALFMVNLGGAAEINRLAIPRMMAAEYGRIIHVASIASGEAVGSVGYNTIKAALGAYIRSLGREMAPYGVVVSGIAPGGFQCPGNAMERLQATNPSAYQEFIDKRLPRGYMGEASELIPLLKYLASPQASMMGGCLVPIDAGEARYYG